MRLSVILTSFIAIALLVLPQVALAGDNNGTITINPDGTVTESDDPMARHDAARAAVIRAEKINPPEKAEPVTAPVLEPEPIKVKPPVKKPAVKTRPVPVPVPVQVHADAPAKPAKAASPKIAKPKSVAKVAKPAKVQAEKSPKIKWNTPPKKTPKPVAIETAPAHVPVAPKTPITRDQALRTAIQVAPPFKRSTILPGNVNGRPVYQVILQTEDGQQDILVDTMTGEIVH